MQRACFGTVFFSILPLNTVSPLFLPVVLNTMKVEDGIHRGGSGEKRWGVPGQELRSSYTEGGSSGRRASVAWMLNSGMHTTALFTAYGYHPGV